MGDSDPEKGPSFHALQSPANRHSTFQVPVVEKSSLRDLGLEFRVEGLGFGA